MDICVQPCRKYNSIFMMGFIIVFQDQPKINDTIKSNATLKRLFKKQKQAKDSNNNVFINKYYDSSELPSIDLFANDNHLAIYENDYIRWEFTQKKFIDILSSLNDLNDHTIEFCMMGYLDKYFITKEVEYRHIFKKNPYIPKIAFTDNMLGKYSLDVACDKDAGVSESYITDLSCQLKIHSNPNDIQDNEFFATTSIDSSIKLKRLLKYSDFISDAYDITNNMHLWPKFIFQTIMIEDILEQVGASGE